MKSLEQVISRIERLANQKRDPLCSLDHLNKSFETHNHRVDGLTEQYKVKFRLRKGNIVAIIDDKIEETEQIVLTLE